MGEHYLPTDIPSFSGKAKVPQGRLAASARLPDVYVDLAKSFGLTAQEIRAMVDAIRAGVKQRSCC
ncbi:MAG TPA: hypothetical protein VG245_04125 [Candidatus Dormibacteraeota bacterium]|nr:hypothetical protein [Candidatus Dormibacteraeota bacterium]